jgi:hypothetical protein
MQMKWWGEDVVEFLLLEYQSGKCWGLGRALGAAVIQIQTENSITQCVARGVAVGRRRWT